MVQVAGRGLNDLLVNVVSLYPKALRSGIGYWTEMVVNSSGSVADMIETAVAVARRPVPGTISGSTEDASAKRLTKLVGRDGIEPPTPGFSVLEMGVVKILEILAL